MLFLKQKYIQEKFGIEAKPVNFVFHGGSGSAPSEITEAIGYGVIKMNIDTDTQWAMWDGVRAYVAKNNDYLQGQIGNPEGEDKPNKNIEIDYLDSISEFKKMQMLFIMGLTLFIYL